MDKNRHLNEVVNNLKQLVVLYGEITEELLEKLEKNNDLLKKANSDIERLQGEKKDAENQYNSLLEEYGKLDEENKCKIAQIAELKQKKIPSVETITGLMNDLQNILESAKKQNSGQDSCEEESDKNDKNEVFDLRDDKASDY